MYNFTIFISDFSLIKKFGNIVFNNFKELNLVGIVSNHKELEHLLKKNKINLIILSEEKYHSKLIQNLIKNIDYSIIITDSKSNYSKNSGHTLFVSQHETEASILKRLSKSHQLIYNQIIRNKILAILESFKFDFKLLGTTYLLESIFYAYLTKDTYKFENLEKNIYPFVSQKYNIYAPNIKWAITRSINNVKTHLKPEDFKINNMHFPEKFTTKYFITEIINHL